MWLWREMPQSLFSTILQNNSAHSDQQNHFGVPQRKHGQRCMYVLHASSNKVMLLLLAATRVYTDCAQLLLLHLEFGPELLVTQSDHIFKCLLHCSLLDALLYQL